MGLTSSCDEFCRRTDNALSGLKLKKIVDDILIAADTYADLEITLKSVLSRCRKHNVTLSADKIEIGPQIRFAGYIVSADGVVPDEEKVKAIRGFPPLKSVRDVRSFLGLANQLGEFTPELAAKSAPLRALLKKGVHSLGKYLKNPRSRNLKVFSLIILLLGCLTCGEILF